MRRPQFDAVFADGRRTTSRHFVVIFSRNDLDHPRLGIVATKKVGSAPQRARIKRRVREWFRHHADELEAYDLVVIARARAHQLNAQQASSELVECTRSLYKVTNGEENRSRDAEGV